VYSGFKTDFVAQYEAFRRRDPALDGVVFVVVKTTGAYCRVCPLALYAWTVQSGMEDCSGGVSRSLQNVNR
jgi:hypothetical protein